MKSDSVINMRSNLRIGTQENRRFHHVVDYGRDFTGVVAFGLFHACGRRIDSRPARYCDNSISFQCVQPPALFVLAFELSLETAVRLKGYPRKVVPSHGISKDMRMCEW